MSCRPTHYLERKCTRIVLAAGFLLVVVSSVVAQEEFDPIDTEYFTGNVPAPDEMIEHVPKTPRARNFLPVLVDLSDRFPKVGDQGRQGSCVAWAVGYAARSYYNSGPKGGRRLQQSQIPSPAYIYNTVKIPDGKCNGGSYIHKALGLLKDGSVSMTDYPYNQRNCRTPSQSIINKASKFKIEDYARVDTSTPDQAKAEIAKGNPVIIGVKVTDSFFKIRGRKVWRPKSSEKSRGSHAVTLVAYNEEGQYFKFINSWSSRWGDHGYGRMSYDAYASRATSAYVMRLAEPPVPPQPPAPPPDPELPEIVLPAVGCGKLYVDSTKDAPVISGFVGNEEDLAKTRRIAEAAKAGFNVALRPWPQCETLMTIEEPLSRNAKPEIILPKTSYTEKDTLSFDVRMADFQGYLHIAYIQKDGNVVNLVKSDPLTLTTLPGNVKLTFGDGLDGRAKFTVSGPFGHEMIIAVASKSPLFVDDRPGLETERDFLTALRKAIIARPDPTSPERFVSANYVVLETKPGE